MNGHPLEVRNLAMGSEEPGSVSRWLTDLKGGDAAAAQPLWERYFVRLVHLARKRLSTSRRRGADEDEEDAALSAFVSFCDGAARGRFPILNDREELWRLLVVITARKASAQVDRRRARKRGGGRMPVDLGLRAGDGADQLDGLERIVGDEPTPEFAAMVAEEYVRLLSALGEESLRHVAVWRMEGYTNDEIADRLGCARRTVARRVDLIRKIWLSEAQP
jgi:DNA-directed RNA polymerase specialized sigma24 family protein